MSTYHLQAVVKHTPIDTPSITPHGLNGANYKKFNHCPFLSFVYITYTILTEIIILIFMAC